MYFVINLVARLARAWRMRARENLQHILFCLSVKVTSDCLANSVLQRLFSKMMHRREILMALEGCNRG